MSYLQFKIDQIRKDKMILGIESIAISIVAMMVTVFLPQLLFQFYYANQQLTAEPPIFKYIPMVSFGVAVLYFVYATLMMLMKKAQIVKMERELMMADSECDCGDGECNCGHDHGMHHGMMEDMDEDSSTGELAEAMSMSKKKSTSRGRTKKSK